MRLTIISILAISFAAPVSARPGFSIGLGVGPTSVGGQDVAFDRLAPHSGVPTLIPNAVLPTTKLDGGPTALYHMGFNILGYAAIETRLSGHGKDLFDAKQRAWAAHAHLGLRVYPAWHWQQKLPPVLQPLEPSLFVGWGTSWQGYAPNPVEEVAWRSWNSWRFGGGLEYFIISYFKLGIDYNYVRAPYNIFIFDLDNSWNYDVQPNAVTGFHQLYLIASFQFGPSQEPVRYAAPTQEPSSELDGSRLPPDGSESDADEAPPLEIESSEGYDT